MSKGMHLKDIKEVPDDVKLLFVTAYEVTPTLVLSSPTDVITGE